MRALVGEGDCENMTKKDRIDLHLRPLDPIANEDEGRQPHDLNLLQQSYHFSKLQERGLETDCQQPRPHSRL
jgi:hypothetical protein